MKVSIEDVINGYRSDAPVDLERDAYAEELYQEAIKIGIEMNTKYHSEEELREIMSYLIGKKVDETFRIFPPFYTDFGKNITLGKNVFIN